jgi:hypothetical protein
VVADGARFVAGEPAPGWLPAGWVARPVPDWLAPERALVRAWAPAGQTSPLVVLARYRPSEVAALARRHGPDVAGWIAGRLAALPPNEQRRIEAPRPWTRAGLRGGRRLACADYTVDGRDRRLHGELAVAQTPDGGALVLAVLLPEQGDESLVARVLATVPANAPH